MPESAKCPIDHELMRELYAEHGSTQAELRGLVEPLSDALAAQITADTDGKDPVSGWTSPVEDKISSGLPYGSDLADDPYTLPPHLFGRSASEATVAIPETGYERAVLVGDFVRNRPVLSEQPLMQDARRLSDELPYRLEALTKWQVGIDPDKWKRYLAVANSQLDGFYHLEALSSFRRANVRNMLALKHDLVLSPQVGRFESYMYRATATLFNADGRYMPAPTGFIVMPVGEYGAEFAEKLLKTSLYAVERADMTCGELAGQLAEGHEAVIKKHMVRGSSRDEARTPGNALLASLEEGVLSITQSLALLTAQKVEGYDNPVALSRAIVEGGLIEQFTRAVPMGLVGPFVLGGCFFRNAVQKTETGIRLNPEVMELLKEWRYKQVGETAMQWVRYNRDKSKGMNPLIPSSIGLTCPAAFAHGGITNVSHAMLTALEGVGKNA